MATNNKIYLLALLLGLSFNNTRTEYWQNLKYNFRYYFSPTFRREAKEKEAADARFRETMNKANVVGPQSRYRKLQGYSWTEESFKKAKQGLNDKYQKKQLDLLDKFSTGDIDRDTFNLATKNLDESYINLKADLEKSKFASQARQYIQDHTFRMRMIDIIEDWTDEQLLKNLERSWSSKKDHFTPRTEKDFLEIRLRYAKEDYEKIKQQFAENPEVLAIAEKEYNYKIALIKKQLRRSAQLTKKAYPKFKRKQFTQNMQQQKESRKIHDATMAKKHQQRARMQSPRMYQYSQEFRAKQLKPREYTGIKPGGRTYEAVSPY